MVKLCILRPNAKGKKIEVKETASVFDAQQYLWDLFADEIVEFSYSSMSNVINFHVKGKARGCIVDTERKGKRCRVA